MRFPRAPAFRVVRLLSSNASSSRPPIPFTQSCPLPTCKCASTPPDLDIDRKTPLLNTMAPYAEQVIICTGKEDWASNIEQEKGPTGDFIKGLKSVIGKGGEAFDVGSFSFLVTTTFYHSLITILTRERNSPSTTSSSQPPRYPGLSLKMLLLRFSSPASAAFLQYHIRPAPSVHLQAPI